MLRTKSFLTLLPSYPKANFSTHHHDHPVLYHYHNNIVKVVLNRPKALNSVNQEMAKSLLQEIKKWEQNPHVRAAIFTGAGGRALSAGGDIRRMYQERGTPVRQYYLPFFQDSFKFFDCLANMKQIQIAFWDGIVIGGGAGMTLNAPIRIATEKALFSMPGGGYYFSRMRNNLGYFIGLTGYQLKGPEIVQCGLANFYMKHTKLHSLEQELFVKVKEDTQVEEILEIVKKYNEPVEPGYKHEALINRVFGKPTIQEILDELEKANDNVEFSQELLRMMKANSPLGMRLVFEQINRGKYLDLRENLKMDLRTTVKSMCEEEFFECVKVVMSKDNKDEASVPNWKYQSVEDVPDEEVQKYFEKMPEDMELNFE